MGGREGGRVSEEGKITYEGTTTLKPHPLVSLRLQKLGWGIQG